MPASLEARRLRKTYEGRVLLDGVDLRLDAGSITTLSGPSGSGKTTLLRILALLADPDEGQLLLDGADLRTLPPHRARRRIALVPQAPAMFPGTVLDNVQTGPRLAGDPLPVAAARELLLRVGLEQEFLGQEARALSGGEKLRVAVARALALRPEAWLLDEPTAALDPDRAELLLGLLRDLAPPERRSWSSPTTPAPWSGSAAPTWSSPGDGSGGIRRELRPRLLPAAGALARPDGPGDRHLRP